MGTARRWFLAVAALAVAAYFVAAFAYHSYNASTAGDFPFHAGFETMDLSEWTHSRSQQLCCPHSAQVVTAPVRSGTHALRICLKRADPEVKGNQRAELRTAAAEIGRCYLYRFSVFVPPEWPPSPLQVMLAQWHSVPDLQLGELHLPPPLRLAIRGESIVLGACWDSHRVTRPFWDSGRTPEHHALWSGPLERGRWIDWAVRIRWSSTEAGELDVWKDGISIATRSGPNTYDDAIAPYLKLGVYVPTWVLPPDERELVFDDVSILEGESTFPAPFRNP